jgi:hypothetical protein
MVTDCIALFNHLIKWLNPTRIGHFANWMVKQGREMWMQFKAWYWGLNCDIHEKFVRMLVPVVPEIDATLFEVEMNELERKTDEVAMEEKLEECLIIDMSINQEFNQVLATKMKKDEVLFMETPLDCNGKPLVQTGLETASEDGDFDEEHEFVECCDELEEGPSDDEMFEARSRKQKQFAQFKLDRKAMKQQRHKIRDGMMERACRAMEIRLRVRHGLVPSNELNEQALRMTALKICEEYHINDADTLLLTSKPVWKAMIPDQMQMDALRIIYNSETQRRLNSVEMLRASAKFSVFNLQPNC